MCDQNKLPESDSPETDAVAERLRGTDIHYWWQSYADLAHSLEVRLATLQGELDAAEAAAGVPPGFVLVPVEPTHDMLRAVHDGPLMAGDYAMLPSNADWLRDMYLAYIAAAPPPPREGD